MMHVNVVLGATLRVWRIQRGSLSSDVVIIRILFFTLCTTPLSQEQRHSSHIMRQVVRPSTLSSSCHRYGNALKLTYLLISLFLHSESQQAPPEPSSFSQPAASSPSSEPPQGGASSMSSMSQPRKAGAVRDEASELRPQADRDRLRAAKAPQTFVYGAV